MKRLILATALIAGLAAASPAAAQPASGPGAGPGMGQGMGGQGMGGQGMDHGHGAVPGSWEPGKGMAKMCDSQDARVAGMLAFAEKRLSITEAQKTAWSAFAAAARASTQPMRTLCGELKGKPAPTTLPERLTRMEGLTAARLKQMEVLRPAVETMYAQLTPEQKAIADTLFAHRRGPGPKRG